METKYYNSKSHKVNVKALEKDLKYKLDYAEKEYALYYYENGNEGIPDFSSEEFSDFFQMLAEVE